MDDNKDSDLSMIAYSPSWDLDSFASSGYPSSLPSSLQEWIHSVGNDDGNGSSSTLSLVRSPSRPQGWPCEKTFHPEREGEMEGDFNEMPRGGSMDYDNSLMPFSPRPKAPSPEASWSRTFSPSNCNYKFSVLAYIGEIILKEVEKLDEKTTMTMIAMKMNGTMMVNGTTVELDEIAMTAIHQIMKWIERIKNNILVNAKMGCVKMVSVGLNIALEERNSLRHQLFRLIKGIETTTLNDAMRSLVLSEGGIHSAYPKNESTRKTSKKMCRNNKNSIALEDLQQFSGSRMDAAKNFGVSISKLKRRCRQLGITDWRHRMIIKKNQYLSKPKDRIEFVHGDEAKMRAQMTGGCRLWEVDHEQIVFPPEFEKGTQMEITPTGDLFVSSTHEQCIEVGHPLELPVQPSESNLFSASLRADAVSFTPEGKLLMDHNISATEAFNSEQIPESNWKSLSFLDPAPKQGKATAAVKMPLVTKTQHTRTVTMKAKYGKDKIRFQLSLTSGINELMKEVAKRLMLKVGTFSIKYLDNHKEWILITCDEDLKDCFDTSILAGGNFVQLLIHNIRPISKSS